MSSLSNLKNSSRPSKTKKLLGRGNGSKKGKTSGRGEKGAGSRSGYKRRWGYEGGQMRLHMKLPKRGFSNVQFKTVFDEVNLFQIDKAFEDGDIVNTDTLYGKGLVSGKNKVKLLGQGEVQKKVSVELDAISEGAKEKLSKAGISFTTLSKN